MQYSLYDFVGNLGVFCILLAYFLLQAERLRPNSLFYLLANFFGAILIIVSLISDFNLSAFIIEFFWAAISLYGMVKYLKGKRKATTAN